MIVLVVGLFCWICWHCWGFLPGVSFGVGRCSFDGRGVSGEIVGRGGMLDLDLVVAGVMGEIGGRCGMVCFDGLGVMGETGGLGGRTSISILFLGVVGENVGFGGGEMAIVGVWECGSEGVGCWC